jgi:hypothetical protein
MRRIHKSLERQIIHDPSCHNERKSQVVCHEAVRMSYLKSRQDGVAAGAEPSNVTDATETPLFRPWALGSNVALTSSLAVQLVSRQCGS